MAIWHHNVRDGPGGIAVVAALAVAVGVVSAVAVAVAVEVAVAIAVPDHRAAFLTQD